jgi:hypothetical protein
MDVNLHVSLSPLQDLGHTSWSSRYQEDVPQRVPYTYAHYSMFSVALMYLCHNNLEGLIAPEPPIWGTYAAITDHYDFVSHSTLSD